jgi:cytochrome b561
MALTNQDDHYGVVAKLFHWGFALTIFSLFGLGWYMVGLDYYNDWYQLAPWWHKSIGATLFILLPLRLVWSAVAGRVAPVPLQPRWQVVAAKSVHHLLYLLLLVVFCSGYLISTADGRPIDVFGWFEIPALISGLVNQETLAGMVHEYAAWSLVGLALIHALAALKHHFVDKDETLLRILPGKLRR